MTFWMREAVFVDFRKWMWKHDTIFQWINLSSLTALTFSVLLKLSESLNSSWWAVLLPMWIWTGFLTLLLIAWIHNIILYSFCTFYDENDWKDDDVIFLRSFAMYFIILYPIPAFGFLLCLKLEGLASMPFVAVISPLLWQLLIILFFSLTQKGGYFMGALVGCIPNPLSRTYYTLVGLISPVLIASSLILFAWFQDELDNKDNGLGIALSFFLIMFLNMLLVGVSFWWLRNLPEATLEEDRKIVWMILFTLIPMSTFELLLFWSLFPEVSTYHIPSWVCLTPVLLLEIVLWILLSIRVQFWKYLQADYSTCQGHSQLNFAKILTSSLLLCHAGSVTLKLVHISTLPWMVINIPFFVLNITHILHLQQFARRHKVNVTETFLRDFVDRDGDKQKKDNQDKRNSKKKRHRKKGKALMDIPRIFNKLSHSYISFLAFGATLVLLSIRLDGWAHVDLFFVTLPISLSLILHAIHTGFHSWYVNYTLFMLSCYDGVDESPSNSASGLFYSAYFSTSSVSLLILGILASWLFDGLISNIWVVIAPLILLGVCMICLIGVFATTEREDLKPLANFFLFYLLPVSTIIAALFLEYSGLIDWSLQYCCLPVIFMELFNLYKGLSWCQPDAPEQPGAPQVLNSTNDTITLFLIPPYDNGSPILQYLVDLEDDKGRTRNVCKTVSTLVHLKDLNMIPNRPYRFLVRAVNAVGVSPPSNPSDPVELKASKPDKPSPPTISYTPDGVLMKWNIPADNGFKITSYTVLVRECESNEERYITLDGRSTFYEVVDLKPGRIYGFSVRATNAAGNSKYSNPKTILYHLAHSEMF